ncbi:MAG: methionyl-tRNA formyltransferase [Candidatus Margulisiibacteriota bacterium]
MRKLDTLVFLSSDGFGVRIATVMRAAFPHIRWAALTQPDRPKGRGQTMAATPFKNWAEGEHIPVYTPSTKAEIIQTICDLDPDLIVMASYGQIVPAQVTDSFFCLNIHPSLLPAYRGATPVQTVLRNGDSVTGVTLMRADSGMDTGEILRQQPLPIAVDDTYGTLLEKLAELASGMAIDFIRHDFIPDRITATPQDNLRATYTSLIKKSDTELLETDTAVIRFNKIRAYSPTPGAYLIQNGQRIQIIRAMLNEGRLIPLDVKPEGKRVMSYADYLLGNPDGLVL